MNEFPDVRTVLYRLAHMSVASDAKTDDEGENVCSLQRLTDVTIAAMYCLDSYQICVARNDFEFILGLDRREVRAKAASERHASPMDGGTYGFVRFAWPPLRPT